MDAFDDVPRVKIFNFLLERGKWVEATEAAAFRTANGEDGGVALTLVAHVRPDDSGPDERARAVQAFAEIVRPFVACVATGVVWLDVLEDGDRQYCLVNVLAARGAVRGVAAWIVRVARPDEAWARLRRTTQHGVYPWRFPTAWTCGRCGYDLRATPDRCPECGEAVPGR